MARILLIGNQTLLSPELAGVLSERAVSGECSIHLVVPQTPLDRYRAPISEREYRFAWSNRTAETVAEHQLAVALEHLASLPATVIGEIGDEDPLTAVRLAVEADTYDEIIVSTFPEEVSKWLGMDVVGRLSRRLDIPVTHVESRAESPLQQSRRRYNELLRQRRLST